jgi:hypothetical protein
MGVEQNVQNLFGVGEETATRIVTTLWWISSIISTLIIFVILVGGGFMVFKNWDTIKKLTGGDSSKSNQQLKSKRSSLQSMKRTLHRCCFKILYCLTCGLAGCFSSAGFEQLQPGARQILRVTFICGSESKSSKPWFVEAWSEPIESAVKNTRTHNPLTKNFDMGREQLDIDWYGDEEEVVFEMKEWQGQDSHLPVGELRIDRSRIEKYAQEAMGQKGDLKLGARRFDIHSLREHEIKLRKARKKNVSPMDRFLLEKFEDHIGVEHRDLEDLQEENRLLRSQLPGSKTKFASTTLSTTKEAVQVHLKLVLRFELIPISEVHSGVDFKLFKAESFTE